jgi:hypothetical protein
MKNNFTSPYGRPSIQEYKNARIAKIDVLVNRLHPNDLEHNYHKIRDRIRQAILIEPVKIEAPQVLEHVYDAWASYDQEPINGINKHNYIQKVIFPFSGNRDLFSHCPSSYSISPTDHGLILPNSNNLVVYVELPDLDPLKAMSMAETLLGMTRQFVKLNNSSLTEWNLMAERLIENKLNLKRKPLSKQLVER